MCFPLRVIGNTSPTGSYILARLHRSSLFVMACSIYGIPTLTSFFCLFQVKPKRLHSERFNGLSYCLANVSSSSALTLLSSSSSAFECHLCEVNLASLKILVTPSLTSLALVIVEFPLRKSSTYRRLRISATSPGSRASQVSR